MKGLSLILLVFSSVIWIACGAGAANSDLIKVLPCEAFEQAVQAAKTTQLIDVRTPEEFNQGTISGAINVDYKGEHFKNEIGKFNKEEAIFVFCARGGRSNAAAVICEELGFKEIYDLEGGFTAWQTYKQH